MYFLWIEILYGSEIFKNEEEGVFGKEDCGDSPTRVLIGPLTAW
jgi:hypothetical protein